MERANRSTKSLLTGQLFVDLDFYPKLAQESLLMTGKYPEIPTIPSTMDEFRRTATDVLAEIRRVPFDKIGQELLETIQGANQFANSPELIESVQTLNELLKDVQAVIRERDESLGQTLDNMQKLTRHLDQKVVSLADSAEETLSAARNAMEIADPNSPAVVNLTTALRELSAAARSIRVLADYLEQHPEALVQGGTSGAQGFFNTIGQRDHFDIQVLCQCLKTIKTSVEGTFGVLRQFLNFLKCCI